MGEAQKYLLECKGALDKLAKQGQQLLCLVGNANRTDPLWQPLIPDCKYNMRFTSQFLSDLFFLLEMDSVLHASLHCCTYLLYLSTVLPAFTIGLGVMLSVL